MIRRVKRSSLERKWLKYIAIFFFNTPAITYSAVSGMSFSLLNFQVLLGLSVSFMSYVGSFWSFGIPLGGIYWLWKIRRRNEELNDLELLVNIGASTGSVSDNVG